MRRSRQYPKEVLEPRARVNSCSRCLSAGPARNAELLPFLNGLYTDKVVYYGKSDPGKRSCSPNAVLQTAGRSAPTRCDRAP